MLAVRQEGPGPQHPVPAGKAVMSSPKLMIADAWTRFHILVLAPVDAPPDQVREMRRAFYAGAHACLDVIMANLSDTGDPDEVTPEDADVFPNLLVELEAFGKLIIEGKA